MKRALAVLPLLLAGCQKADSFAFQNTSVTLPDDTTTLPEGAGVDAVLSNCLACHSPAMILTQPRLTRKEWEAEVAKMAKVYKAPIDPAAVPQIVDYLVAVQSQDTNRSEMRLKSPSPLAGEGGARRRLAVGG